MDDPFRHLGFTLTPHARRQLTRRGLPLSLIAHVIESPEQRMATRPGRETWQSRHSPEIGGKVYLVRVVLDFDRIPPEIITAYRTSRVEKYWKVGA